MLPRIGHRKKIGPHALEKSLEIQYGFRYKIFRWRILHNGIYTLKQDANISVINTICLHCGSLEESVENLFCYAGLDVRAYETI